MRYRIYGVDLESDVPLPGFVGAEPGREVWTLSAGVGRGLAPRRGRLLFRGTDDEPVELWRDGAVTWVSFADGTEAILDASARTLALTWPERLTFEDALTYLVGPVLGVVLRLEGRQVLHASAVEIDGHAVALMGPAGAGKSTLTAALVERGHSLVSEDVAALDGSFVFRGGARVKLWEDSVEALRGSKDALPRIVPTNESWTKRFLEARMVSQDRTPLRTVYLLDRREVERPFIEEIAAADRVMALVSNVYAGGALDAGGRAQQLTALAALVREVRAVRLVVPNDLRSLPATCDLLSSLKI